MGISCKSLAIGVWRGAKRHALLFSLTAMAAGAADHVRLVVSHESAPAGTRVQIKVSLAEPKAVSSARISLRWNPAAFGDVTAVAAFSAAGDAVGYAIPDEGRIELHVFSSSSSIGVVAGLPVVVITVPMSSSPAAGAEIQVSFDAESTAAFDARNEAYAVTTEAGGVRVGGSLSISEVKPAAGVLAAGTVVRIVGTGFKADNAVEIEAVRISDLRVVDSSLIEATLGAPAEIGGKWITVRGAGDERVQHYASSVVPRIEGEPFAGAIPILPTASFDAGREGALHPTMTGYIVLENPGSQPAAVVMHTFSPVPYLIGEHEFTIEAGGSRVESLPRTLGGAVRVLASQPLRMLQLARSIRFFDDRVRPLAPTSIPALEFESHHGRTDFIWRQGTALPQPLLVHPSSRERGLAERVTIEVSTSSGGSWLSVLPARDVPCPSGMNCSHPGSLALVANPASLPPGIYRGTVKLTPAPPNNVQRELIPSEIPVALTVLASGTVTNFIGQTDFSNTPAGLSHLSNTFQVFPEVLPGSFTVRAQTDSGGNWLRASSSSPASPASIHVSADPTGMPPGTYSGVVLAAGSGGSFAILSTLSVYGGVQLRAYGPAVFALQAGGPAPAAQSFAITAACQWNCPASGVPRDPSWTPTATTQSGGTWLTAVRSGVNVVIRVNPSGLTPGVYTGAVTIRSEVAAQTQVPVALNVWSGPGPALTASPSNIVINASYGSEAGHARLCASAGFAPVDVSAKASTTNGRDWLKVSVEHPVTPTCGVNLVADPSGLAVGTYRGSVSLSAASQMIDVPVQFVVGGEMYGSQGPPVLGAVMNAASARQGAIAAGQIVTIRGTGIGPFTPVTAAVDSQGRFPTLLGGSEVLIDGRAAPLLYASATQINAIIPDSVTRVASVQVRFAGMSATHGIPVADVAPGLFTLTGTGVGRGAVLNQDNSVNDPARPAARGSVIQIFGTGASGPVSVSIGGIAASVMYSGQAAGLLQVNAVVPSEVAAGDAVPIVVSAAGVVSQGGVTIAVR